MSEQNDIDTEKIVIALPPIDDLADLSPGETGSDQWKPVLADWLILLQGKSWPGTEPF